MNLNFGVITIDGDVEQTPLRGVNVSYERAKKIFESRPDRDAKWAAIVDLDPFVSVDGSEGR